MIFSSQIRNQKSLKIRKNPADQIVDNVTNLNIKHSLFLIKQVNWIASQTSKFEYQCSNPNKCMTN